MGKRVLLPLFQRNKYLWATIHKKKCPFIDKIKLIPSFRKDFRNENPCGMKVTH